MEETGDATENETDADEADADAADTAEETETASADAGADENVAAAAEPSARGAADDGDVDALDQGGVSFMGTRIVVIGDCTLRDAIVAANEDRQTGGCPGRARRGHNFPRGGHSLARSAADNRVACHDRRRQPCH